MAPQMRIHSRSSERGSCAISRRTNGDIIVTAIAPTMPNSFVWIVPSVATAYDFCDAFMSGRGLLSAIYHADEGNRMRTTAARISGGAL